MVERGRALVARLDEVRSFHDACGLVLEEAVTNAQRRRLKEILSDVESKAKEARAAKRSFYRSLLRDPRPVVVFASFAEKDGRLNVDFEVDHCNPRLIYEEMERRKRIGLPINRFKRLMDTMFSYLQERAYSIPGGDSIDRLVYDNFRASCAEWMPKAFGKRRAREFENLKIWLPGN